MGVCLSSVDGGCRCAEEPTSQPPVSLEINPNKPPWKWSPRKKPPDRKGLIGSPPKKRAKSPGSGAAFSRTGFTGGATDSVALRIPRRAFAPQFPWSQADSGQRVNPYPKPENRHHHDQCGGHGHDYDIHNTGNSRLTLFRLSRGFLPCFSTIVYPARPLQGKSSRKIIHNAAFSQEPKAALNKVKAVNQGAGTVITTLMKWVWPKESTMTPKLNS